MPAVSVIVPTYQREGYLGECLDSLLAQTLPLHQLIVVDDGSTDATPDIVASYGDRIVGLRTGQLGKPGALNRALGIVSGDYVWVFDDDDVADPDAVERFVAALERHPEHAYAFSTFRFTIDEPGSHRLGRSVGEYAIPDLESRGPLIPLLEIDYLGGAALFARKRCYDELGGYDTRLLRSQDYEMAVRIARRFTGVRVEGPPTFHYRRHRGMRGPGADRFGATARFAKWLEYDQVFFRELYHDLRPDELLPPGVPVEGNRRRAVLQRMAIMASKLLVEEVVADLAVLAGLDDDGPLDGHERAIVTGPLLRVPYYAARWVLDDERFRSALEEHAGRSRTVREIRGLIEEAVGGQTALERRIRDALAEASAGRGAGAAP